jgi:hypothetical protein
VLEQVQTGHEARRQAGTTDPIRVEGPERRLEPAPVDQPGQAHQRMPRVHQGLQPRAEEILLRLGRGLLGAHRRAPCQGCRGANHATSQAATAMPVCKVLALDSARTCKSGYFPGPGKPQKTATPGLFHGRLRTVAPATRPSGCGGRRRASKWQRKGAHTPPCGQTRPITKQRDNAPPDRAGGRPTGRPGRNPDRTRPQAAAPARSDPSPRKRYRRPRHSRTSGAGGQ